MRDEGRGMRDENPGNSWFANAKPGGMPPGYRFFGDEYSGPAAARRFRRAFGFEQPSSYIAPKREIKSTVRLL